MSVLADFIAQAAPSCTGRLLLPSDPDYDDLRRVHNGLIDKHPAVIASCAGIADVADAVRLARTLDLEIAVRGGGHNVAGHGTIDDVGGAETARDHAWAFVDKSVVNATRLVEQCVVRLKQPA